MRLPEVVLKDAAAYIEQHGWIQGRAMNRNGEVCMVGAVGAVVGCEVFAFGWWANGRDQEQEMTAAIELLNQRLGTDAVAEFNDAPGRTKDEVLRALRGE